MIRRALVVLTLGWHASPAVAQAGAGGDADLILRNARIWTGDSAQPRAQALAVRGERLVAVGTNAQVDAHRSPRTRVIDAGGRFITPGFIDDHTHFAQAGALLIGAAVFLLQDYENQTMQENLMMFVKVDDLDEWWRHIQASGVVERYRGVRAKEPTLYPWGMREVHLIDPAGVCWHFA